MGMRVRMWMEPLPVSVPAELRDRGSGGAADAGVLDPSAPA